MTAIEKELREALALMDSVPVAGRVSRARMTEAESKILAVANAVKNLTEQEKEEKQHDHNDDGQGNDA